MGKETVNFNYQLSVPSVIHWPEGEIEGVLLLLHGHAQMGAEFFELGKMLSRDKMAFLTLQAPHAFTTIRGNIASTWMSRFNRDNEVASQIYYLNQVADYLKKCFKEIPIHCLGFSQGASVAYRAAFLSKLVIRRCLIVAGDLPPEVKEKDEFSHAKGIEFYLFHGEGDSIVSADKVQSDVSFLQSNGIHCDFISFAGGHEVPLPVVAEKLWGDCRC